MRFGQAVIIDTYSSRCC